MLMAVLLSMGALIAINAVVAGTGPNQDKLVSGSLP
ncbi:MAG: hypothetical protein QOI66_3589 [Myxococcales bacterium]|jgi:hypothetical protein|nr:hypothetical protein [Myxococcales bacterium]